MVDRRAVSSQFDRIYTGVAVSRRNFALGLTAAAASFAAACSSEGSPKPYPHEATLARLKANFLKNAVEVFRLNQRSSFDLSSGLRVTIFSNGELGVNPQEYERAFNEGLSVLNELPDNPLKKSLQAVDQNSKKGMYRGRDLIVFASSNPNSCFGADGRFATYTTKEEQDEKCVGTAFTASLIPAQEQAESQQKGQTPQVRLASMVITPNSLNGVSLFTPDGAIFQLSPAQALTSHTTHEAVHCYLRMNGVPQSEQEEGYVQKIEKTLLEKYQSGAVTRPQPFVLPQ